MKTIRIECAGSGEIDISEIHDLQGSLKNITDENIQKLKSAILQYGFSAPIFIWTDGKSRKHIIDGHTRKKALLSLKEEGYEIPKIPTVDINAKTKKEAKEKLLYIASQYGDVDFEGIWKFTEGLSLTENIRIIRTENVFDLFNRMESVKDYTDLEEEMKELDGLDDMSIKVTVPKKHAEKVIEYLANGELKTSTGLGKGVMKRCGLL